MPPATACPDCGATLPPDAPRGFCPGCLIRLGLPDGPASSLLGSELPDSRGVLAGLAATIGSLPSVLLRDIQPDETPTSVVQPSSSEMPEPAARSGRLQ